MIGKKKALKNLEQTKSKMKTNKSLFGLIEVFEAEKRSRDNSAKKICERVTLL